MFRFKIYFSTVFLFFLFSCQSETEEQSYNAQETIVNSSPLTSYLQRVAMVKTVGDNIVDQSNYCTIKLPYTVTVNNTSIAINTTADYQKVLDNINANTMDNDIVTIDFPVTMVYYNYIEKLIPNESDFNSLINYWNMYPDLLSKINGLNINYPITINVYNSSNQAGNSVAIANDQAFFNFIKNLTDSQYISLKYPVSITDCNYQTRSIETNLEFENTIKYAIDNCAENNIISLDFATTLINGSWKIPYFYDDSEKTSSYSGYVFVFKSDKSVVATKDGVSETGKWETKIVNGTREFELNFNSAWLYKLGGNWKIFEFNNSIINLRDVDNNNSTKYFFLEKKKY